MRLSPVGFLLALVLAAASGASAQTQGAAGRLDASLHAEVPEGAAIWVRPATGSALHREIARRVATALAARGYRVVQGRGQYELTVRAASAMDFELLRESWVHLEDNAVMVHGQFSGARRQDIPIRPRILLAELHDAAGDLAWSARASLTKDNAGQDRLLEVLLPGLLAAMFTTTYDQAVRAGPR